jgi:predicted ATPase
LIPRLPVKEFNFNLTKDFVVIFGKNNLGKSYAISAVYLVLKNLLNMKTIRKDDLLSWIISRSMIRVNMAGKEANEMINAQNEEISTQLFSLFQELLEEIEQSFYNTFDNMTNQFSKEIPSVTIQKGLDKFTMEVQEPKLVPQTRNIIAEIDRLLRKYRQKFYDEQLTKEDEEELRADIARVLEQALFFLDDEYLGQVKKETSLIFLPASRSGLYQGLNSLSQIMVELSKSRRFASKKLELPNISEPCSDYFLGLSSLQPRKLNNDNPILGIVNEIEQTILKGEVIFDEMTKKIFYKPHQTDLVLDISVTSSMVSELSPIICYLKYQVAVTNSKSILFIEEPEANLHPEVQVQLMEIFAKLVKANIKIVITSHSDYLFNKLNNLILEGKIDIASIQATVIKETPQGSLAKDIPIDKLGIDDENFLEIAQDIFNEKLALIEKLNDEDS